MRTSIFLTLLLLFSNVSFAHAFSGAQMAKEFRSFNETVNRKMADLPGSVIINGVFETTNSRSGSIAVVEEDAAAFQFAFVMAVYQQLKTDPGFVEIIDNMFAELSEVDPSVKFTGNFSEKTASEQAELTKQVKNIFSSEDSESAAWQFKVGEEAGVLFGHLYANVIEKSTTIPANQLKNGLTNISALLPTAPKNFTAGVLERLKTIAGNAAREDIGTIEAQEEIAAEMLDLLDAE